MNIISTITGDCKYLNIVLSSATPGSVTIDITNGTNTYSVDVLVSSSGTTNHLVHLESTIETNVGVFRIKGTDSNYKEAYSGVLGSCSLDCCIAKKVDSLIGCGCGCSKCNDKLTQAERVLLLISGIRSDLAYLETNNAQNIALYVNAENKYKKALDLCFDNCGCGC